MSGKWIAILAVVVWSVPAGLAVPSVKAQYLDSYLSSQRDNNRIRHQQKIRQERLAQQSGRKGASWRRHVEACRRAYRSYDPKTDRYAVRRGVTRKCTL